METLSSLTTPITIIAIAGCGPMAGLFFVFSFSVMGALKRLLASDGMKAMQLINRTILNPVFLGAFLMTALACLSVAILSAWLGNPNSGTAFAGAVLYLIGGFGVTAACNVPLNNELEMRKADSVESREMWGLYLRRWTRWNHVRTAASIAATVMLAAS